MNFAVRELGGIDVLVNNAGLLGQEHQIQLADLETALWDRTMDVNLKSVFLASKHAIPYLIGRGGGSIINISSAASVAGYLMSNAYAASKGGVNVLRSEEHTSELQSLMRISYAVFCLKKTNNISRNDIKIK